MPTKMVTAVELFLDLVFVFAVTRASELLQEDHSWPGVLRALVAFVPVFWLWVGTTMVANLHEIDTVRGRATFFGVALAGLTMALALPLAYEHQGVLFAAAYWAGRVVLYLSILRSPHRAEFVTFPVGAFVTGPALLVGALLPLGWQTAVWAAVAALELATPALRRSRLTATPFDTGHLADRYSTFIIIALGETVVATGAAVPAEELELAHLVALVLAFGACFALWWTYFDLAAGAIETALEHARVKIDVIRPVLSYGHLALVAGIVGVAAAIGEAVREPAAALHRDLAALLFGGAALYLATFGFTRWRLLHSVAWPRLAGALACLVLALVAPAVPALVSLAALVVVLAAVAVADHVRERRHPTQPHPDGR